MISGFKKQWIKLTAVHLPFDSARRGICKFAASGIISPQGENSRFVVMITKRV
jgi:putative NIF3 family GTP cyclohydrolase 1 type 2